MVWVAPRVACPVLRLLEAWSTAQASPAREASLAQRRPRSAALARTQRRGRARAARRQEGVPEMDGGNRAMMSPDPATNPHFAAFSVTAPPPPPLPLPCQPWWREQAAQVTRRGGPYAGAC